MVLTSAWFAVISQILVLKIFLDRSTYTTLLVLKVYRRELIWNFSVTFSSVEDTMVTHK